MSLTNQLQEHTEAHRATGYCIHELIEEQVARTPDSPALITPDRILSYRDLNQRANALATRLRSMGVGPEVIVAICLERSAAMIVGILATLKAGGVYAPVDQASPSGRLASVPASVVMCESRAGSGSVFAGIPAIRVDENSHYDLADPEPNLGRIALPANLAYVIYTSGSTGQPKGVAVEHRALVNSTKARAAFYRPPSKFLLISAAAFDSAVAGIYGTLTRGGALYVAPSGAEADPREVASLIAHHQIDALLALPSLYEMILESADAAQLASLRTVTVAGERCPPRLATKSRAIVPAAEFVNEYGPAEGTVWSTAWRMAGPEVTGLSAVPIGRPVDGVLVRLLDSSGQPVRPGEAAEMCLAGAGLARGYLQMPGLTAGSFLPDPAGPPGSRMYRTGDLAMLRADGELEFLGRIDRQLKVGGFRIEPVEVEEALTQFPGVRQAAVVESPRAISTALAAFVTGADVNIAGLRDFLRSKLPSYMVPAQIRAVSELPKTANGKIDHRGLTRMLTAAAAEPQAGDQPWSATERVVARLWCDTLGRQEVSRTDSFLDLGGSLDVMRIAVHLSRLFKMQVPLLWVYEAPTVASVARLLESAKADVPAIAESCLAAHSTADENSADSAWEG